MQFTRSLFGKAAAIAALALAAMGTAHARDVYWSVGVQAAPGVSVGVANSRPVIVQPAPVYVQPAPVYVQPAPQVVYTQPQVIYPVGAYGYAPVVVQPQVIGIRGGGHGHGHWKHGHGHGHGHGRHWD